MREELSRRRTASQRNPKRRQRSSSLRRELEHRERTDSGGRGGRRDGERGEQRERADFVVGAKGKSNRGCRISQNFHITGLVSLGMPLFLGGTPPQSARPAQVVWPWAGVPARLGMCDVTVVSRRSVMHRNFLGLPALRKFPRMFAILAGLASGNFLIVPILGVPYRPFLLCTHHRVSSRQPKHPKRALTEQRTGFNTSTSAMATATASLSPPSVTPQTYHRIVSDTLVIPSDPLQPIPVGLLACQRPCRVPSDFLTPRHAHARSPRPPSYR